MRIESGPWVGALVLALLFAAVVPFAPVTRAAPMALLQPPFQDYGLDQDRDGQYDYLVVQVPVNVTSPGPFKVTVSLGFEAQGVNETYLDIGLRIVVARLPGWQIFNARLDGPYTLTIVLREQSTFLGTQLDEALHVTGPYVARDFDPPPAIIEPPFADAAVDLDSDGKYDELWINFTANVTTTAYLQFWANLNRGVQGISAASPFDGVLAPGRHPLTARIAGPDIRRSGLDGPYDVEVYVHAYFEGALWTVSRASYRTASYAAASFVPPSVEFRPGCADEGLDADGNGLYDALVVRINVTVDRSVVVVPQGELTVGPDRVFADPVAEPLGPGNRTVNLTFDGIALYAAGVNTTYDVVVYLQANGLGFLGFIGPQSCRTSFHKYTEFERVSAAFAGAVAPSLVDADGDGRADFLRVDVPIAARREGDFWIRGMVLAGSVATSARAERLVHMPRGEHTLALLFSGIALNRSTSDGPYQVALSIARLGNRYDESRGSWTTPPYSRAEFESRPVTILSGAVRTASGRPTPWASVTLADPTTKFIVIAAANATGHFSIPAYDGTFEVLYEDPFVGTSSLALVAVSGPTTLLETLDPWVPISIQYNATFARWDESTVTADENLAPRAAHERFSSDIAGDFDGIASPPELDIRIRNFLPSPFELWTGSFRLSVDNETMVGRSAGYAATFGSGSIPSSRPLVARWSAVYGARGAVDPRANHSVEIRLPYDADWYETKLRVSLPPGFASTAAATANVTVAPAGRGEWSIDPGGVPAGRAPGTATVWVNATYAPAPPSDWILPVAVVAGGAGAAALVVLVWRRRRGRSGGLRRSDEPGS